MDYKEYAPCPALADFVKCIWILEAGEAASSDFEKIFPDGNTELIFHFGSPFLSKKHDVCEIQQPSFLYGQLTRYIEVKPTSKTGVLGVRFKPFGLSAFTTLPQHGLQNNTVDLGDIFNHHDAYIDEKIFLCRRNADRVRLVEDFLIYNLLPDKRSNRNRIIGALNYSIKVIKTSRGNEVVKQIAHDQNVSIRELQRRFKEYVGLSPKQLIRIIRFQDVLSQSSPHSNLTSLAYDAGYYDQSHFIHDFKEFSGHTPAEFLNQKQNLTEIFYDN